METGFGGVPTGAPTDRSIREALERAVDGSMSTAPPPQGAGTNAEDRLEAELRRLRQGRDPSHIPFSPGLSATPGFGNSSGAFTMNEINDLHAQQMRAEQLREPSPPPRALYPPTTPTNDAGGNTRSRTGQHSSRSQPSASVHQQIHDWEDRPRRDRAPERYAISSHKSRSPTPRSDRRTSQRAASQRRPQHEANDELAEMRDSIETYTTNQLAGVARHADTAS